ncbi:MAG: glycosyltransferase family 2 protein [Flavobacteriaceae bacterium]|nr:glycosyltransferase family 2 protein [Flavobacteriaceae bacterium]
MPNTISIIIVTYNAMPWLKRCLDSTLGYEVVVVDNASQDETVAFIKKHYPKISLFEQTENLGFGRANNIGISYALQQGAEAVFLLNQDAYLVEDALEKLIQVSAEHPDYGVLSPIHTNGDGTSLDANFALYASHQNNANFYSDFVLNQEKKAVYEVPFVNAAGWLVSKKCLQTVGGFDPLFFHYGEDDNYCQRVHYHGLKVGIVKDSLLIHDREFRLEKDIKFGSAIYFKDQMRHHKYLGANINKEDDDLLSKASKKYLKSTLKSMLKFSFKNAQIYYKEYRLIKKLIPEVAQSRIQNRIVGPNYLER